MPIGSLMQGDDWTFKIEILDSSGAQEDITGGAVWLTFKSDPKTQDDASADFQLSNISIAAGDDPGNQPTVGLVYLRAAHDSAASNPPDTTDMTPASYQYDIQYRDPGGVISTIEVGTVSVTQEVTRST